MHDPSGVVYEVTLDVQGESAADVDAWLDDHVQQLLELPGFIDATTYSVDGEEDGHVRRVTHYLLESDCALEDYLAGPAAAMRGATGARFGDGAAATRRILRAADPAAPPAGRPECLNCSTVLRGQYCSRCGQRARGRLISTWELVRDAFGDLFELDSRLWQTLIPLMFRPGQLTRDYLMGRRARFMPPFRTYLVLSVVFFVVAFFDPQREFGVLLEPDTQATDAGPAADTGGADSPAEIRRQVIEELESEGIPVPPQPATEGRDENGSGASLRFTDGGTSATCDLDGVHLEGLPGWLGRRLTRERLQKMCEKISADSGREFLDRLLDNAPAALFVLLPLMALVLKALYPLSKRYYVEHLLFVLHFHAFFFLILTLEVLWSRLVTFARLPEFADDLTVLAISIYIPAYLYKAMRRVYAQGRGITTVKYVVLWLSYLVGFSFMLLIATFYTAFSI